MEEETRGVEEEMITKDENSKIRHLMASIESAEGVNLPLNLCLEIASVYAGLKRIIDNEEVEQTGREGARMTKPRMCIYYIGVGYNHDDTSGDGGCLDSYAKGNRLPCKTTIEKGACYKKRSTPGMREGE